MPSYTPPQALIELHQLREKMTKHWSKMSHQKIEQEIKKKTSRALKESGLKQVQIAPGVFNLISAK